MYVCLTCDEERGAAGDGISARLEGGSSAWAVADTSRRHDRELERGSDLVEQLHEWRRVLHVATSLNALGDHDVRPLLGSLDS